MKVVVEFECDNAAFDGQQGPHEAERILRDAGYWLGECRDLHDGQSYRLKDVNGNLIGQLEVKA